MFLATKSEGLNHFGRNRMFVAIMTKTVHYIHTHTHTHTHIQIYIHTYIHTHTHTYN